MTTQKAVAMEAKLLAVLSAGLSGVRVTDLCAELGISRQTFYKYRRRFEAEGPAGLVERSRAPRSSPQAISGEVEDEIVRLRKTLEVDNGAQMIAYHLERGGWPVPAVSTIHRALVRRGLVDAQPAKRPRSAVRRFQWPRPNDAWQIDATLWALADGRDVWVMDVLDDCSRVLAAARVCEGPTAQAAWDALCHAAARWGLPAHLMSDNGSCFTARLDPRPGGAEVDFERDLRALGVRHIPSTPGHPQTCGKLERSHQTTKRWLATQPPAATPEQLQRQLDCWLRRYNHHRPHRALRGATPAEAWRAADRSRPGPPIPELPHSHLKTVTKAGVVNYRQYVIKLGAEYHGSRVLLIDRDDDLAIFGPHRLHRRLTLNPGQRYYPNGRPVGGPRRPRILDPND